MILNPKPNLQPITLPLYNVVKVAYKSQVRSPVESIVLLRHARSGITQSFSKIVQTLHARVPVSSSALWRPVSTMTQQTLFAQEKSAIQLALKLDLALALARIALKLRVLLVASAQR